MYEEDSAVVARSPCTREVTRVQVQFDGTCEGVHPLRTF